MDASARARRMRVAVGGVPLDLLHVEDLLRAITFRLERHPGPALAVASVNLDHVRYFGRFQKAVGPLPAATPELRWIHLADGWPARRRASRLTGDDWPLMAGSDLLPQILAHAELSSARVGFLGGTVQTQAALMERLVERHPRLDIGGMWSPSREAVDDPRASAELAAQVRAARVDILVVGLGKPRQELWLSAHGVATGAVVMLPFGAAADFMAGTTMRAPRLLRRLRLEWLWRLGREPRRMARRYLVEGPRAMLAIRHGRVLSGVRTAGLATAGEIPVPRQLTPAAGLSRQDAGPDHHRDVDGGGEPVAGAR